MSQGCSSKRLMGKRKKTIVARLLFELDAKEQSSSVISPDAKNQLVSNSNNAYTRGREGRTKFFTAWKVSKVCLNEYIKNYLFF